MLTGLDHIILGVDDLHRGVDWVEQQAGVRAVYGGVHPGRGTRNALLALGPDSYLEIMAPDPEQPALAWFPQIETMREPRLLTWAAHTSNLDALARNALAEGFAIDGPRDGKRMRPDGKVLSWRLFHLRENRGGLLPFFIEWGGESAHPSTDAPSGCRLKNFWLESPQAGELERECRALSLALTVNAGVVPRLCARLTSPLGEVDLTS